MIERRSRLLSEKPDLDSAIDLFSGWVQHRMREQRVPGLSAGIVHDQELLWARGFGYNDAENELRAEVDTLYRIASITKLLTSIAVLQLRDAGRLRLDDPVATFLPWFAIRQRHEGAVPITIRHLLTHTSGLPRDASTPMWTEAAFPTREELIAALPDRETALPPETRWKYSNLAFALAGEIVAAVSGEEYAPYIHRHILEPLGMRDTFMLPDEGHGARLARGYGRSDGAGRREKAPFMDAGGFVPAFSAASTVEDLARFASWQIRCDESDPVLRRSTLSEMQRVQWLEEDWKSGAGLGFGIRRIGERVIVGHGGGAPGHSTLLQVCPKEKLAVIVLMNVIVGEPMDYAERAIELVFPTAARTLNAAEETPSFDPAWERYCGRYANRWGEQQVIRREGRLAVVPLLHPAETPGSLIPESGRAFRMEKGSHDGERVSFDIDERGRVVRMHVGGEYLDRLDDAVGGPS